MTSEMEKSYSAPVEPLLFGKHSDGNYRVQFGRVEFEEWTPD